MKLHYRILSLLTALSLFMAVAGFSIYEHYCGKNLVAKSLYTSTDSCHPISSEDHCGSAMKDDCCSNSFEFVHLEVELKNPDSHNSGSDIFAGIVFPLYYSLSEFLPSLEGSAIEAFPQPFFSEESLYLLQQKLIFYG